MILVEFIKLSARGFARVHIECVPLFFKCNDFAVNLNIAPVSNSVPGAVPEFDPDHALVFNAGPTLGFNAGPTLGFNPGSIAPLPRRTLPQPVAFTSRDSEFKSPTPDRRALRGTERARGCGCRAPAAPRRAGAGAASANCSARYGRRRRRGRALIGSISPEMSRRPTSL
ncbi:hypothetical protein EVAR_18085_1 [Eumeta japonica]|uniref:Uncharacterized protein n=1 Tax=Eumeta variegata TaxID=151549 RepID=A0A4C1VGZ6_EUMVA|nr:hypothetical protein EVAR_18085_1 [Eumeta japonica]